MKQISKYQSENQTKHKMQLNRTFFGILFSVDILLPVRMDLANKTKQIHFNSFYKQPKRHQVSYITNKIYLKNKPYFIQSNILLGTF